jgi:hypothetical protein
MLWYLASQASGFNEGLWEQLGILIAFIGRPKARGNVLISVRLYALSSWLARSVTEEITLGPAMTNPWGTILADICRYALRLLRENLDTTIDCRRRIEAGADSLPARGVEPATSRR